MVEQESDERRAAKDWYDYHSPTQYSISPKNISDWWDKQKSTIVMTALHKRDDKDRFVEWVSEMLDEMNRMRNG